MLKRQDLWFWLLIASIIAFSLWGLSDMLLPFILGIAIAYFLDPVVDRLEDMGGNRSFSAAAVFCVFVVVFMSLVMLIGPILKTQFMDLINSLPKYIEDIKTWAQPWVEQFYGQFSTVEEKEKFLNDYKSQAFEFGTQFLKSLWDGGMALFDVLSIMIITPVVAFYLLRDWDIIVEKVNDWLPRKNAPVIRKLLKEIDETISGFVRGQSNVCLLLSLFYGLALTLYGLNFGLFIGLIAGILSFIPYVGSLIGFVAGVGVAWFQFGNLTDPAFVALIFIVGQLLEGNILTPKLVGEKVGLHAVWILFALLAGGSILGFVGVMVAVPFAAVIGVFVRFSLGEYLESSYYTGVKNNLTVKSKSVLKPRKAKKKSKK